jgi:hypothetical protein
VTKYNLFPPTATVPQTVTNDSGGISLGTEFWSDAAGATVTSLRWWCPPDSTGLTGRQGAIYLINEANANYEQMVTVSFPTATAGTWCEVALADPIALTPLTRYIVAVFHPDGKYPATAAYFNTGEGGTALVQGPIHRPNAIASYAGQGSYYYADFLSAPVNTFGGGNYWSDVTIDDGAPAIYSPAGIASAQALGLPTAAAILTASPAGIASATSFGAASNATTLTSAPAGIASAEALGTPTATSLFTASPAGIPSAEAFGSPSSSAALTASPTGIGSADAFGTPTVGVVLVATAAGIGTLEQFGDPSVGGLLASRPTGIASLQLIGTPTASGNLGKPQAREYAGKILGPRYAGRCSNLRWDGTPLVNAYPRETVQFQEVVVTQNSLTLTSGLSFAVVKDGERPDVFTPAVSLEGKLGVTLTGLGAGTYRIYAQFAADPEIPVIDCGYFYIT